ncbi:uncharacterized protein LOC119074527 isoform X2 [Bradysia coprophila]|uniref:uncharacterized protein LOC119074527 isoform X2 n=1 Tax=Bradysia coprophila TaxID=38358 RepID=UPI00187D7E40|nr:uncharacterized protein LOC119074527 isoform X2 [Bradysia coprophila]
MSGKVMKIREGTIIKESNSSTASHCQNTNQCIGQHQNKVNRCKGDMDDLKIQLDREKQKRNTIQSEYGELKQKLNEFCIEVDENKKNPISKYDAAITKQSYFNDTLAKQVCESKEKLKNLSQSLKHIEVCGKDCNIHMRDLLIDYNCISKSELTKEIKRFQRMQIDLKSNLDRLQWRLDCESKIYHSVLDQYHKMQMDLYYLKNLNEKTSARDLWC